MGNGKKIKSKPTGAGREFSTVEDIRAGTSTLPRNYRSKKQIEAEAIRKKQQEEEMASSSEEEEEEDVSGEVESSEEEESGDETYVNLNNQKNKLVKARDADPDKKIELSRHEREELEKQRSQRLLEKGKTEQARLDLERLTILRQQRADAAKKREEEKAAREEKKKLKEVRK